MQFTCSLILPADVLFVPVARHFCQNAMTEFGVDAACKASVSLAITEACANVVEHSQQAEGEFEINLELNEEVCIIRVIDTGIGISDLINTEDVATPESGSDRGRGLYLMKQMVDKVRFESRPEKGTIVHLEKTLTFENRRPSQSAAAVVLTD